jgi:hypothetical protein
MGELQEESATQLQLRRQRPAFTQASCRTAEGCFPLRRIVHCLVVVQLDRPLLIFRREQREDGGNLVDGAPNPLGAIIGLLVARVISVPVRVVALVYVLGPPFVLAAASNTS